MRPIRTATGPMLTKILIVVFLLAILGALFSAVFFLVKDPSDAGHKRTMRALTWRVLLQLALIVFLIVAFMRGWIQPHGLYDRPGVKAPQSERPG
jgi:hypothetical protein